METLADIPRPRGAAGGDQEPSGPSAAPVPLLHRRRLRRHDEPPAAPGATEAGGLPFRCSVDLALVRPERVREDTGVGAVAAVGRSGRLLAGQGGEGRRASGGTHG